MFLAQIVIVVVMVRRILVSWIGHTDLRAAQDASSAAGIGPVAQALETGRYDDAFLLIDYEEAEVSTFRRWLERRAGGAGIHLLFEQLSGPTEFGEIYTATVSACEQAISGGGRSAKLTFHLSPGTPAMAAVLIESSRAHGVRTASVPFDISADFIPDLLRERDCELARLSANLPPDAPEFEAIPLYIAVR